MLLKTFLSLWKYLICKTKHSCLTSSKIFVEVPKTCWMQKRAMKKRSRPPQASHLHQTITTLSQRPSSEHETPSQIHADHIVCYNEEGSSGNIKHILGDGRCTLYEIIWKHVWKQVSIHLRCWSEIIFFWAFLLHPNSVWCDWYAPGVL